jgi:surfeit locus 1 family protein
VTHAGALENGRVPDRARLTAVSARRAPVATVLLGALCALAALGFAALGVWQIERRAWKLDLIARVEARIHAEPTPVPGPDAWPARRDAEIEYRRVTASGRYLPDEDTRVQALTERGAGFWVLTPFRTDEGFTVLVNRGFVPTDARADLRPSQEPTRITGLLRLTEPGGGFLRANDPARGRWYSRDVAAIAAKDCLPATAGPMAPFFIDADAAGNGPGQPVGGLTVVSFRNAHLVYALTWFALALLSVGGGVLALRERRPAAADA